MAHARVFPGIGPFFLYLFAFLGPYFLRGLSGDGFSFYDSRAQGVLV